MINFLKYYKDNYRKLTKSKKKIIEFIGKYPDKVATLSAVELGRKIGVSDASIIRTSRLIGFEGYADLKSYIIKELSNTKTPAKRIKENWYNFNTSYDIVNKMVDADLKGLEEFLKEIDIEDLEKATNLISSNKKVYIMGIGASRAVAEFLSWHMRRIMIDVTLMQNGGIELYEHLSHIKKDDTLLIITFPGTLIDELKAIETAKSKGGNIITITGNMFSEIGLNSDIVFKINVDAQYFFNSYVVVMEFCNILLMSLLEKNKKKISNELHQQRKKMDFLYLNKNKTENII